QPPGAADRWPSGYPPVVAKIDPIRWCGRAHADAPYVTAPRGVRVFELGELERSVHRRPPIASPAAPHHARWRTGRAGPPALAASPPHVPPPLAMTREFALPDTRPRYAPDRVVDIEHLRLAVEVEPEARRITGTATLSIAVIAPATR